MPQSPENLLISSVLVNGDLKSARARGVTSDMFHTHREEWAWLEEYYQRHKKQPSKVAFRAAFPDFRINRQVNDTDHFSGEVRKSHARYTLIDLVNEVVEGLNDNDVEGAVKKMQHGVLQVASGLGDIEDTDIFEDYGSILRDAEGRVRRARETGSAGIPFGIPTLDEATGGSNPGDFVVVSARLGHAKSWILQHWAATASAKGYTVLFDALEMSRAAVAMRIHGLMSSSVGEQVFKSTALMRGVGYDIKAYRAFLRKLKDEVKGRLHVADNTKTSPLTVAAQIEKHQPDIVYVDYIGLMAGAEWQEVKQTSNQLKGIAMAYGVRVVAAAQLNREGESRGDPSGPENLAGSDAIGQDADMIVSQRQTSRRVIVQKLTKYRNGAGGMKWYLHFDPDRGLIKEVTFNQAQDLMDRDHDEADKQSVKKVKVAR